MLNIGASDCSLARGLEAASHLESIVDVPLETGEGADHENTGAEAIPEAVEADAGVDLTNGLASLVHDADHGVGGVGHDSAEDTSPVTSQEGDKQLSALRVGVAGSGEDVSVEGADGLLKSDELHDSVGDLTAPEGHDALVEGIPALSLHHLGPGGAEGGRE